MHVAGCPNMVYLVSQVSTPPGNTLSVSTCPSFSRSFRASREQDTCFFRSLAGGSLLSFHSCLLDSNREVIKGHRSSGDPTPESSYLMSHLNLCRK